jgi:hypothetical protein
VEEQESIGIFNENVVRWWPTAACSGRQTTVSGGWQWVKVWVCRCNGRVYGAGGKCWGQGGKVMGKGGEMTYK